MSCCNDHRLSGQAEALDHWAATLETYANDIDAMISRGMYRGKFKLVEQGRRDEQRKIEALKIVSCGGCGQTDPIKRCVGCVYDFGDASSAWVRSAD